MFKLNGAVRSCTLVVRRSLERTHELVFGRYSIGGPGMCQGLPLAVDRVFQRCVAAGKVNP